MDETGEVLLVAGMCVLVYGLLLGVPLAGARMKAPAAPHHLLKTHVEALIGSAILLALIPAAEYSTLPRAVELPASVLFISGVVLSLAGGTVNWRSATDDAFAARSAGFYLQAASGPMMVLGALLLAIGVAGGLRA